MTGTIKCGPGCTAHKTQDKQHRVCFVCGIDRDVSDLRPLPCASSRSETVFLTCWTISTLATGALVLWALSEWGII